MSELIVNRILIVSIVISKINWMVKYSDMLISSQSGTNHKKSDGVGGGGGGGCGKRVGEV